MAVHLKKIIWESQANLTPSKIACNVPVFQSYESESICVQLIAIRTL